MYDYQNQHLGNKLLGSILYLLMIRIREISFLVRLNLKRHIKLKLGKNYLRIKYVSIIRNQHRMYIHY